MSLKFRFAPSCCQEARVAGMSRSKLMKIDLDQLELATIGPIIITWECPDWFIAFKDSVEHSVLGFLVLDVSAFQGESTRSSKNALFY